MVVFKKLSQLLAYYLFSGVYFPANLKNFPTPLQKILKSFPISADFFVALRFFFFFKFFPLFQIISSLFLSYIFPICFFLPFSFVFLTYFSVRTCFYIFFPANLPHIEKLLQPLENFPIPQGGGISGKYTPLYKFQTNI